MIAPDPEVVREVLRWYVGEMSGMWIKSGLLSMQEGSDWQDLFCTRGKGLYLNCLYVMALRRAAELFEGEEGDRLRRRAERINSYFWYAGDGDTSRPLSHFIQHRGHAAAGFDGTLARDAGEEVFDR